MDDDLAFCLGRFIDDQVKLIDKCLEQIQEEEQVKLAEIEKEQTSPVVLEQKLAKGTHAEDQEIVDRFIQDLRESVIVDTPRPSDPNRTVRENLRAELSTKLNACSTYLGRLRNLAKRRPNSSSFEQRCTEAIDLFRRGREFDENFNQILTIIDQSNMNNCVQNVQQWWNVTYGYVITEINLSNRQFNPAVTENNFAILSPTSRVIQYAKAIVQTRQSSAPTRPQKYDVICVFVRKIQSIDKDLNQEIPQNDFIDRLNNDDIQSNINYAENWLKKRDEIRNRKDEDSCEVRLEKTKNEFARQRIAQESKKLALAVLLRRLAVGSNNVTQFDQTLKQTLKQQQQQGQSLPVLTGDLKDPSIEELPLLIELTDPDVNQWSENTNGIRETFANALCIAFLIPINNIRIEGLLPDNTTLQTFVLPPYGKIVIESLNGTAPDSAARIEAVRKCCLAIHAKIQTIRLGDFGLKIEDRLMDPKWNRTYIFPNEPSENGQYWAEPLQRGGKPYYCPSGWMRFGVKVSENEEEFDRKWGHWYLAYHGTQGEYASSILSSGLRVSTTGCFYQEGRPRVYVSPSIEYCAHPRYARPWKKIRENGQTSWYQLIFQCRVNPKSVQIIGPETLIHDDYKNTVNVDPNFSNNELTWVIPAKEGVYYMNEDIICYGIMMRTSNTDPKDLSQTKWWQHAHIENFPYDD